MNKTQRLNVRLTERDKQALFLLAESEGLSVSAYLTRHIHQESKKRKDLRKYAQKEQQK